MQCQRQCCIQFVMHNINPVQNYIESGTQSLLTFLDFLNSSIIILAQIELEIHQSRDRHQSWSRVPKEQVLPVLRLEEFEVTISALAIFFLSQGRKKRSQTGETGERKQEGRKQRARERLLREQLEMMENDTREGNSTWALLRKFQISSALPSTLRATTAWAGTLAQKHFLYSSTGFRVPSRQSSSYSSFALGSFSGRNASLLVIATQQCTGAFEIPISRSTP